MIALRVQQGRLEAHGATAEDREHLGALRDAWEERAAILEHDAKFSRVEAERLAFLEVVPAPLQAGAA